MSTATSENFTIPNQSQLNNLMEGCYVRIRNASDFCWVEIDEVENGGGLAGTVHTSLEDGSSNNFIDQSRVSFTRDQVTHVGCNRFCFC